MQQLLIGELFYSVSQPYDLKIGPKLVLNLVNPQLTYEVCLQYVASYKSPKSFYAGWIHVTVHFSVILCSDIYLQIYYIIPFESFVSTFKFTGMIFSYKHKKQTNIFLNHRLVLP